MKKFFSILAVTAIIIILSVFFCSTFGKQNNPENAGREVCIKWEEVNARDGYSTSSKVITVLENGDSVILTGNSYEYAGGDGRLSSESWTQIQLSNGLVAWVVTDSIAM